MAKRRADTLLVLRGLAASRSLAKRLVMAGKVRANGQVVSKPAMMLEEDIALEVAPGPRYVSRGGEKLEAALTSFHVDPAGCICADVGASTGGFTDCLIQFGAQKVYAIDVGHGVLHWRLRQDHRVVVMERTNARYLERLPEPVDLVVMDASFISCALLIQAAHKWFNSSGDLIVLIKPQFEAGRQEAARGRGVIRDPKVHRSVLLELVPEIENLGLGLRGLIKAPLKGAKGNLEFLGWFRLGEQPIGNLKEAVKNLVGGDQ